MKAALEIRIWNDDATQPSTSELADLFEPQAEHVASLLAEGYQSGRIVGDGFIGWWEIKS